MIPYRDIDGDSGVTAYELQSDGIVVEFDGGARYLYTDQSAGAHHIAEMTRLARAGDGLNAYINRHVRRSYARKL